MDRQEDVRRLEVSVNDVLLMKGSERAEDGQRDRDGVTRRQRAAPEPFAQRLSLEELHREEQTIGVLIDFVQLTDVRMVHARGGSRLAPEPLLLVSVGLAGPDP